MRIQFDFKKMIQSFSMNMNLHSIYFMKKYIQNRTKNTRNNNKITCQEITLFGGIKRASFMIDYGYCCVDIVNLHNN